MATLDEVIKKQLVEATAAKTASKELTVESIDAMTDKEFDTLIDGVEQLDELSQKTLGSYLSKKLPIVSKGKELASKLGDKEFDAVSDGDKESAEKIGKRREVVSAKAAKDDDNATKALKRLVKESTDIETLEEAVSRKDFKLAASTINQIEDKDKRQEAANLHAKIFSQGNPRFNHSMFHTACGTTPPKNESTVSTQVATLLEAEDLSEEFKTQAVTIFEAAVTDRVIEIEDGLKIEFDKQIAEARAELNNDIDGFLNEAVQQWKQDNEVAITSNFKSQMAESFMDGLMSLISEHNIEVPEGKENALEVALTEVDKLNESITSKDAEMQKLVEQVNTMKAEKILESFSEKMTQTEFDRFKQLTESFTFETEEKYEKQLSIVLENFGKTKTEQPPVVENVVVENITNIETITNNTAESTVSRYANYLSKNKR